MSINHQHNEPTEEELETQRLVKDFLENGGKITKCAPNARTEEISYSNTWGKKKPKSKEE